jgi:uncharacterized protein YbcI/FixJ family two-component response regulator
MPQAAGLAKGKKAMPATENPLRVLVVDDNRDGADAFGLLIEGLGNQVHVTYGGTQALGVATAFRPDMDGCRLVVRIRQIPVLAHTIIVAITGQKDEEHKALAVKAGFDLILFKPITVTAVKAVLSSVAPVVTHAAQSSRPAKEQASPGAVRRLSIDEARRIRNERKSRTLTQEESEAAVCDGIMCFQEEYLGWRSEQIHAHLIKDLLVVRILGVLTLAERQLGKAFSPEKGRNLIKQVRTQLLELARPMLESLVHEVVGVKVVSMHHDMSTVTGEEVIIFSLTEAPRFQ